MGPTLGNTRKPRGAPPGNPNLPFPPPTPTPTPSPPSPTDTLAHPLNPSPPYHARNTPPSPEHRPACDPAGTVFRLCPRRQCLGTVTTSRSANTASPATLPEQFSVMLKTRCFGYVTTSRSADTDPPAALPGQFTVLPRTTALRCCIGFSQGRAHVRQRPMSELFTVLLKTTSLPVYLSYLPG